MSSSIPVNYIRQWCFCPRIVYYIENTPFTPVYPVWVRQGETFHIEESRLWQRRNLSRFGLEKGRLYLDFSMDSEISGFHGIADMLVETDNLIIPIEFKLESHNQKKGGILQLLAYGLLARETFQKDCDFGFLAEGKKTLHKIEFTKDKIANLLQVLSSINHMLDSGIKPDTSASILQCTNCEYINHCNDR